jgi:hypothetical protein
MFGALDVGIFITGTDDRGRKMRLDFATRDIAVPDPIGIHLIGEGTGTNGSLTYDDTATIVISDVIPGETTMKAPPSEIAEFIRKHGRTTPKAIMDHFAISEGTLANRREALVEKHGIGHRRGVYFDRGNPQPQQTHIAVSGAIPLNQSGLQPATAKPPTSEIAE